MKWHMMFFGLISLLSIISPATARERRERTIKEREPYEWGLYGGVGVAYNDFDLTPRTFDSQPPVVQNPSEITIDSKALGYSLYAGFRLRRYLALDLAFTDFGSAHYHLGNRIGFPQPVLNCDDRPRLYTYCLSPPDPTTVYGPSDYSLHMTAIRIAAKGSLPIHKRWSIDGHLGLGFASSRASDGIDGYSKDTSIVVVGLGTTFAITPQLRVHLDWDSHRPIPGIWDDSGLKPDYLTSRGGITRPVRCDSLSTSIEYRYRL